MVTSGGIDLEGLVSRGHFTQTQFFNYDFKPKYKSAARFHPHFLPTNQNQTKENPK
jgi:hypothetical protein